MKFSSLILFLSLAGWYSAQYAPCANDPSTTAIHKDSNVFVGWGSNVTIERGWKDRADTSLGRVTHGESNWALFKAEGNVTNVVSLGDGGVATYYFPYALFNGPGPDFAIFENGFTDGYCELAFVEVSSDGIHFVRFPNHSLTQTQQQAGNGSTLVCSELNNLAGKYKAGYGVPFDLEDLIGAPNLSVDTIHYVRIIDVVGSINPSIGQLDSQQNLINDPYPTPFESGGFDLDAIGIIHQSNILFIQELDVLVPEVYPNPFSTKLIINGLDNVSTFRLMDISGKIQVEGEGSMDKVSLSVGDLPDGIYVMEIRTKKELLRYKLVKQHS